MRFQIGDIVIEPDMAHIAMTLTGIYAIWAYGRARKGIARTVNDCVTPVGLRLLTAAWTVAPLWVPFVRPVQWAAAGFDKLTKFVTGRKPTDHYPF